MKNKFQSNLDGMTLGGGSIQHPLSIHSASIGTCRRHRVWQVLMTLVFLFTLSIGQMWAGVTVFTSVSQETTDGTWTIYGSSNSASEQSNVVFPTPAAETGFPTGSQSKTSYYSKLSGTSDLGAKLTTAKRVAIAGLAAGDQITVYWFATNTTSTTVTLSYATGANAGAKIEDKATTSVTSKQVYSSTFTALTAANITNITSAYSGSAGLAYISSNNSIYIYAVKITASGGDTPVCPETLTISSKDSKTAFTEGDKIELTAALSAGNGSISYQWYKDGTDESNKLTGKTAAKLEIASCTTSDAGDYYCVASKTSCSDAVNASAFAITVAAIQPTGTATISYALSGSTTTGTVTGVNSISGLSSSLTLSTLTLSGTKDGYSGGIKGCTSTTELVEADYVDVQFTVGSSYVFTPSAVTVRANPLNATGALKAVVKVMDAQPLEVASEELACAKNTDNAVTFASGAFTNKKFEGTVHLRMYFYGAASDKTFYLKSPISITGTVAVKPSPVAPSISAPDADQAAVYDLNDVIAPLEITASGYPTPTYQWYSNSSASTTGATAIEGAQSASYTPANDVASDLYYYCVATNASGSATSHYFHVTVNAPTVPTIYTETIAMTLTSNKVATDSKNFTFSGANLGETAVTLVLASAVDGLTLSTSSVTPTAGSIADTEVTVSYKSVVDVAEAHVNLYLKQGDDILHTIDLTYSSTAGIEDLTSISAATTWNWDGAADAAFGTLDQNAMIVLANADVTWDAGFNALAIAGKLQHYYRDSKYAQGHELKFNTTIPGRVTVTFSNTGGKDIARAPRITDVNGSYAPMDEADGSKNTTAKAYTHNVAAGDVLIAGFEMQTGTPANMLRFYKVEFVPTYTVAYAANGGSGDMTDANAYVAGDEVTLLPNTFTPAPGFVWSGWTVKDANNDDVAVSEGKFTMPASNVTVTAQWDDASKVAVIVETSAKYESLADAVAAATDGQTIQLLQNNYVNAQVEVAEKAITLDLAGYKIEYTGTSTLPSGVILVHNGASLTIDDSSDPDAGSIVSGNDAYAAVALTKAGDNPANPATLVVNGGALTGHYYGITGNGSRNNTVITINGGTITGTVGIAIYHPQVGTLTVNNGSLTGVDAAIEMRAGTLVINDGTFTATATEFSCDPNGSGSTTSGAAIAIAQHTTKKDIEVTINGGTFNGVKALNESNPQVNDPAPQVDLAVTGGDFTGEVSTVDVDHFISGGSFDAPVSNENCAEGFVPSPLNPVTGKYSVEPKDGTSLIKAVATAKSQDIEGANLTGVFKGAAHIETSDDYKMDTKKYFMVQLVAGQNFQAGDIVKINVSAVNDCNGFTIYSDIESDGNFIPANLIIDTHDGTGAAAKVSAGINEVKLPEAFAGSNKLYVGRASGADKYLNAGINQVEVTRAMNPQLLAITINERVGVIDEANKTVAVTIPYEADLAALTIVPTIAWNEAAAANSIVVNNGGAWVENPSTNSYKLTDKDGDYTVYTITLTRDVLKHTVKFYDGETLLETLEVENGTSIAAGDVPADPEKEDYLFQGWAETADGAAVDVTSFTISAAKNFYAKWVSDGAIKLIVDGTSGKELNTTDYITGVTIQTDATGGVKLAGTVSDVNSVKDLTRVIAYNSKSSKTKIQIKAYNTNSSDRTFVVKGLVEGADAAVQLASITLGNKETKTTDWIEFNNDDAKNRTIYIFSSSSASDIRFLQVKVIDDGATATKKAGEAGYSLNFNKGRFFSEKDKTALFEGLSVGVKSSDCQPLNSTVVKLNATSMIFTAENPILLKVNAANNKTYYVANSATGTTNETAKTGVSEFNLAEGTWYINASANDVQISDIAFELPKAATPVIETQPATNHTFAPGDMTATVVATVTEGTLHYQWYKKATVGDDEEVGTDAATLTTTTEGTYYVVVTNTLAGHQDVSVTSEEAELGYRVTNDATLSALSASAGTLDPAFAKDVEEYRVDLPLGTVDVPTLSAMATMAGYADVAINNATAFVNYEATSTVVVTSEDGTANKTYTVKFYVDHQITTLVDVTGNMSWDFSKANDGTAAGSDLCNDEIFANVAGIVNNNDFESDNLKVTANKFKSGKLQASMIKFHTTVDGMIRVVFSNTGSKSQDRYLTVNGRKTDKGSKTETAVTYTGFVYAGDVELGVVEGDGNMLNFTSVEFVSTVAYPRTVNPNNIGTLCWTNNAVLGGATLYKLVGKNEYNKLVFDEVDENRLEAGKPYIFVPENGNTEIKVYNTDSEEALTEPVDPQNGMMGTFVNLSTIDDGENSPLWNKYIISNNHYVYVDYANCRLGAYRAYITSLDDIAPADPEPGQNQNGAPRRRIVMGAQSEQVATGCENLNVSDKPVKMIINGQLFILRGEKMYDAKGQLVK